MLADVVHLWHRAAREPWLLWSVIGSLAVLVTLITLVVSHFTAAATTRATAKPAPAPARVRTLAERGMAASDIARRTGISQDAVATIMRASRSMPAIAATPVRQSRPSPARTAARRAEVR